MAVDKDLGTTKSGRIGWNSAETAPPGGSNKPDDMKMGAF